MASFYKLKSGLWRAQVERAGVRESQSFRTKAAAQVWASQTEAEIDARKRGQIVKRSMREVLERYSKEVSPTKKNAKWEQTRIKFFLGDFALPFAERQVSEITAGDLGKWRDERLQGVKGSTINRDLNLLSNVFTTCRKEWGCLQRNPIEDLRRPADPRPRDKTITWQEARAVLRALDWRMREPVTLQQEAGFAFLMSLHTAMRAGEVLKADYGSGVAVLLDTKNGDSRRVPLSGRALRLSKLCPAFTITSASLDALFRKARKRASLAGFTFHDARATALTRMSQRVDVMELARISGHKDLNILLNTYYRVTAETLALRLR